MLVFSVFDLVLISFHMVSVMVLYGCYMVIIWLHTGLYGLCKVFKLFCMDLHVFCLFYVVLYCFNCFRIGFCIVASFGNSQARS